MTFKEWCFNMRWMWDEFVEILYLIIERNDREMEVMRSD